ncbi:hypothetical protein KKF91_13920 [Myxococcota bacterium]|nr:hypothetical protein [Myxococcota bacterium]
MDGHTRYPAIILCAFASLSCAEEPAPSMPPGPWVMTPRSSDAAEGDAAEGDAAHDQGAPDAWVDADQPERDARPTRDAQGVARPDAAMAVDATPPAPDAARDPCPAPEIRPRGALTTPQAGIILPSCVAHEWRFTAQAGQRVLITLRPLADLGEARLALTWPNIVGLAPAMTGGVMTPRAHPDLIFTPPLSGEYRLLVQGPAEISGRYDLSLACDGGCAAITRHPMMLVHGWTGWGELMAYTYFYGVRARLEAEGFQVFVAELDPYNAIEIRAGQLAAQVDAALAAAHATQLNLIAHSQGGLDSRHLISALGYGDRIATLTTISTPHRGTPLLDVGLGLAPGAAEVVLSQLLNLLGATLVESRSNARASFEAMTEAYVQGTFNPSHPDDPRVRYISYAGRTCALGISCDDICDIEIQWSHAILSHLAGDNDGIVPVSSAIWGDYRGEIPADHFDEVGQLAGITGPNFDHLSFYEGLAWDLAREGF